MLENKAMLFLLLALLLCGCIQPEIKVKKKEVISAEDLNISEIKEKDIENLDKIVEKGKNWVDANNSGIYNAKRIVIVPYYEGKELNVGKLEIEIKKMDLNTGQVVLSYKGNLFETINGSIEGNLNSYTITLPYYWRYANSIKSGLIFFAPEGIKEMKETIDSATKFEFLQRMPEWFKKHISFLGTEILKLRAENNAVSFELKINGKKQKIKAMRCIDSMNNKYIISLDESFPIILQFEYSNYFRKKTEINSYLELQENVGFKVIEIYK